MVDRSYIVAKINSVFSAVFREWAGVELDAALGKNDGSVDGKRYFQCSLNFGLFAPLHKITKSPRMKMMKPSAITPRLKRESSTLSDAGRSALPCTHCTVITVLSAV